MVDRNYKPKYNIGQKVVHITEQLIGTIERIDNKCSKIYDEMYDNPGHLEYYISWKGGAWSRHYCFEFDQAKGEGQNVLAVTPAVKILYGPDKTNKREDVRS